MTLEEVFSRIDKVTTNDILRVAKQILKEETLDLAVIGPHKNEKKVMDWLKM